MISEEVIRSAATDIRNEGGEYMWIVAVADWLDNVAERAWGIGLPVAREIEIAHALQVATAYLNPHEDT